MVPTRAVGSRTVPTRGLRPRTGRGRRVAATAAEADGRPSFSAASKRPPRVAATRMGSDGERFVFFSGGTALNSCARELANLPGAESVTHVLPVSDDGGSTAEIVRVLGGPAVGDIRSRCLRLASNATREQAAVNTLLGHRLDLDESSAKKEWYRVIEGEHDLWAGIENPYRQVLLSYLALFQMSLLRSSADPPFNFSNGSVGNFFFAGARTFFKSLEAAIFLYQKVSGIPEHCDVLPCVCTEDRLVLGAELRDGTVIRGQNEISHPPGQPGSSPLPSPIRRVLYLAYEGQSHEHEIQMEANARVVKRLREATCVVYGMGSLYTSLCPSLILEGIGETIASKSGADARKVSNDRERHTHSEPPPPLPARASPAGISQALAPSTPTSLRFNAA